MMFPRPHKLIRLALVPVAIFSVMNLGFAANSTVSTASPAEAWRYADVADMFAASPVVLHAKIASATPLKGASAPAGTVRFYVEANVIALIRSARPVLPHLAWLVDMRPDSRGRIAKLKNADVLVAAFPVPDRPGQIRLAARDAQVAWSPAIEARVRAVITSVAAPDAPPAITGVTSAFHSAGTVPGEGETQIFLSTVTGAPVSMTVLTRPGQPKRWAFALGEIVDEAAAPPAPDTLAWYRLACFLPRVLPDAATAELGDTDVAAARDDYAFVVQSLGACSRTRS